MGGNWTTLRFVNKSESISNVCAYLPRPSVVLSAFSIYVKYCLNISHLMSSAHLT